MQDDGGDGSGTVLDMHTQQGKKGVRFEDPQWWTHLPSLKPIGLTCLLAETGQTEVLSSPLFARFLRVWRVDINFFTYAKICRQQHVSPRSVAYVQLCAERGASAQRCHGRPTSRPSV